MAAQAIALVPLHALANEPMHPAGLALVLLAALAVAATMGRRGLAVAAGLVVAVAFIKINLGVLAGVALAIAWAARGGPRVRVAVAASACLVPVLLLHRDLGDPAVARLATVVVLACAAVAFAAAAGDGRSTLDPSDVRQMVSAGAVVAVVIVGVVIAEGSTLRDVVHGVLVEPLRLPDVFSMRVALPATAPAVVATGVAAVLVVRQRSMSPRVVAALKVAAAGAIAAAVVGPSPVGADGVRLMLALASAAVAAMPPRPEATAADRSRRVLLGALPVLESLQVYPVAGTQVHLALALFAPVAALAVADAVTLTSVSLRRRSLLTVALAGAALTAGVIAPAREARAAYSHGVRLDLPGCTFTLQLERRGRSAPSRVSFRATARRSSASPA